MRILVISSAPVIKKNRLLHAYPPFVDEMEIWFKNFGSITLIAPGTYPSNFNNLSFKTQDLIFVPTAFLQFGNLSSTLKGLTKIPKIFYLLFKEIKKADHIHLRCPGNVSLIGCLVQIFFPSKPKTVKYAGNWDPGSKQPLSYKLQRWIVSNTFLSRNMKVLVYGEWPGQSKNILPFYTATYSKLEQKKVNRDYTHPLKFIFVGTLSEGKQPLLAIQLVEALLRQGKEVSLKIFGGGILESNLREYIKSSKYSKSISLEGFLDREALKSVYQKSHFLILPSRSEGWPKVIAEAMFHGCIPIATSVSCVPWMLGYGKRGILISHEFELASKKLSEIITNVPKLKTMSGSAQEWSGEYTLEKFENDIKKLL